MKTKNSINKRLIAAVLAAVMGAAAMSACGNGQTANTPSVPENSSFFGGDEASSQDELGEFAESAIGDIQDITSGLVSEFTP